jgi:hypothetical protein
LYAHEGLHIIDIRDTNKEKVTTSDDETDEIGFPIFCPFCGHEIEEDIED